MTTTLSVQAALNQLKVIKSRIEGAASVSPVASAINGRVGNETLEEWTARASAAWQSSMALIANYRALKSAIVQSNAITQVTIGGVTMTVAEAIEWKKSIDMPARMRDNLALLFTTASSAIERHNTKVMAEAQQTAQAVIGKKEQSADDEYTRLVDQVMAHRGASLADAINVQSTLERLNREIEDFRSQVDLVLTSSNVVTMIEVDLVN
jgi:esterase/lipase